MTKAILIDPTEQRKPARLAVPEIPINAYVSDPAQEAKKYGRENLVRIYRDMVFIREFETMLDRIKKEGVYEGIEYNHKGPAHLSIGQEVGGGRHGLQPDARRLHLRLAPQPRRNPGQVPLRHRASWTTTTCWRSWRPTWAARTLRVVETFAKAGERQGPGDQLRALRHAGRDLRPRAPASTGAGRLDARLLPALRRHAQQRHRRRLGATSPSARRSSSASTASPASSSPTSATPPWAAARSGKA